MTSSPQQGSGRSAVAVLGTGSMGSPIARNLLAAGFPVSAWNRTAARAALLVDDGALLASSPADAAKNADVVLTMLADGAAVHEAMSGPAGALEAMRPDSTWIQMATVGLDWTGRLSDLAAEHGVELVDAPVSGSDGPAREAKLIVLASGPDKARARVQPIFDAIGRETIWLGPTGGGTRMKLVLNNWLVAQVEAVAETLALTEALGLDPHLFPEAIDDAPLGSRYAVAKARAMISGDYTPGFALRLAFKDASLALDAAQEMGLSLPLTAALAPRWRQAIADGHADDDVSSVFAESVPRRHQDKGH
ncbi:MAG TPA: NAD(P)-dependent oxidoreductase [Solirubrobacteraceae bacterium]|nr:NAD(P)-dependent oxidoreductase [Solirubrobacteraceae bacterium]